MPNKQFDPADFILYQKSIVNKIIVTLFILFIAETPSQAVEKRCLGDADHYNGLPDLLDRFPVGEVLVTPGFEGEKNPGRFQERLEQPLTAGDRPVMLLVDFSTENSIRPVRIRAKLPSTWNVPSFKSILRISSADTGDSSS